MASLLTPQEHRRIDEVVTSIEHDTSADLSVVVTRVSDRYALYPIASAAVAAILLGALISLIRPDLAGRTVIAAQLWLLLMMTLLLDWLPLRLRVVPKRVKHARAQQLALREFNAHVIAAPKRTHRILLFVALGERYVEVVADHETHAMAPDGTWKKIVDEFLATVTNGRVADGIAMAAAACGAVLKQHHPQSPDRNP